MNLENQVVSLELSKKLKELLGDKAPESYFNYRIRVYEDGKKKISVVHGNIEKNRCGYEDSIPAYSLPELGEMLPDRLDEKAQATDYETHYFFEITKDVKNWEVSYRGSGDSGCKIFVGDENLSNAMAKVLIYLKDNNLIK